MVKTKDTMHGNTYWNERFDYTETGGISPANDALYAVTQVSKTFLDYYDIPIINKDVFLPDEDRGQDQDDDDYSQDDSWNPLHLNTFVHVPGNNAGYDMISRQLYLGDGDGMSYYPFTSLTTVAHELAHGFTHQQSGLVNTGQAQGLNEAFSDMTAQIVEYHINGKNRWVIGADEAVDFDGAFRWMDNPRRGCIGKGREKLCQIDHMKDYIEGMDGHLSTGIFDKAFYLLSTSKGFSIEMAYNVMLQANMRYWLPNTNFAEAACGVIDAAKDYGYDLATVRNAFANVGLNTQKC